MDYSFVAGSRLATLDKAQFSAVLTSQSSTVEGGSEKGLIASAFNTVLDGVNYVAAIATNGFNSTITSVRDYTLVSDHIHAKELNLELKAVTEGDVQDGDLWLIESGGTTTLNVRVGGVTKSVTLV